MWNVSVAATLFRSLPEKLRRLSLAAEFCLLSLVSVPLLSKAALSYIMLSLSSSSLSMAPILIFIANGLCANTFDADELRLFLSGGGTTSPFYFVADRLFRGERRI